MFGFLVKKTFFDLWDNMFRIIIMNVGFIVLLPCAVLLAPQLIISVPWLGYVALALLISALR